MLAQQLQQQVSITVEKVVARLDGESGVAAQVRTAMIAVVDAVPVTVEVPAKWIKQTRWHALLRRSHNEEWRAWNEAWHAFLPTLAHEDAARGTAR
jgi:hypothetical protein